MRKAIGKEGGRETVFSWPYVCKCKIPSCPFGLSPPLGAWSTKSGAEEILGDRTVCTLLRTTINTADRYIYHNIFVHGMIVPPSSPYQMVFAPGFKRITLRLPAVTACTRKDQYMESPEAFWGYSRPP